MKTVCKLLCLLLILTAVVAAVHAADDLEEVIIDSCLSGRSADLSAFKITETTLDNTFQKLLESGKLPWYTTGQYSYTYEEDTGIIREFTPENLPDSYDRDLYEQKLCELMSLCIHPGMTDLEIALSVHDTLILMGQYDEGLNKNTPYDLLIDGTSVCAGYTDLYRDILNRAGVPCVSVNSEAMEHTWNLVQLGDSWYHVDLTWDDPTPDVYGSVKHEYFLLTDEQISSGSKTHFGWSTTITCSDDQYRLAYWRMVESPVIFPGDGYAYYLKTQELSYQVMKRELSSGQEQVIFEERKPTVLDFGQGSYTYYHTGLSYWDGDLYVGTLNKIHALDLEGNSRVVYEYDTAKHSRYVYSCYVQEDVIYMVTATHEGDFGTDQAELTVSQEQLDRRHSHNYTQTMKAIATCTEPGYATYACDCGLTYQSGWKLLEHSYQETTADGLNTREACTVCGLTRVTGTLEPVAADSKSDSRDRSTLYITAGAAAIGGIVGLFSKKRKRS